MTVSDYIIGSVFLVAMLGYYIALFGYAYWSSREDQSTSRRSEPNRIQSTRPTSPGLTLDEAIDTHWDEIQAYVNGVDEIEACDLTNVGCYTLPADVIAGHVDTIHFPNGGSLSFFTPIDESGTALETDFDGRLWEFTVDMNSSLVENAVDDWAQANGYRISR